MIEEGGNSKASSEEMLVKQIWYGFGPDETVEVLASTLQMVG